MMVRLPVERVEPVRLQLAGGLVVDDPELWGDRSRMWLRALVARVRRAWTAASAAPGAARLELVEPDVIVGRDYRPVELRPLIEQLLVGTVAGAGLPWHGYVVVVIAPPLADSDIALLAQEAKGSGHALRVSIRAGRDWAETLQALWESLWIIPTAWTRRQWQLHQQFRQVGPAWTQVAQAARMSLSACSHMATRMHHAEWESGLTAWLRCLNLLACLGGSPSTITGYGPVKKGIDP